MGWRSETESGGGSTFPAIFNTRRMSLLPEYVKLEPIAHKYFSSHNEEYMSVSKILHHLEPPFDSETVSYFSARKQLRIEQRADITGIEPYAHDIRLRQKVLLAQWAQKNKDSTDVGTLIHNTIEHHLKFKMPTGNQFDAAAADIVQKYLSPYKVFYAEEVLYSNHFLAAGTADFLGQRTGGKNPVIDIIDYKTNASKGIQYRSEYGKYMLDPVTHLEQCSYNHYCLQQSIYARFLEEHGFRLGQIRLVYVPPADPMNHFVIPVPYMKQEAEAILLHLHSTNVLRGRSRQTINVNGTTSLPPQ